jgi:hypothetical protein
MVEGQAALLDAAKAAGVKKVGAVHVSAFQCIA